MLKRRSEKSEVAKTASTALLREVLPDDSGLEGLQSGSKEGSIKGLFGLTNVTFEGTHAYIKGTLGNYNVQLGSGVIHRESGGMVNILPVHSQHRGKIFLPFIDEDPKTAEILSKILLLAEDRKIKDPYILQQLR